MAAIPQAEALAALQEREIVERANVYGAEGKLHADLKRLWDRASTLILQTAQDFWTPIIAQIEVRRSAGQLPGVGPIDYDQLIERRRLMYTTPVDAAWVRLTSQSAVAIHQLKIPSARMVMSYAAEAEMLIGRLSEAFADDQPFVLFAQRTVNMLWTIELEIALAYNNAVRRQRSLAQREEAGELFRTDIGGILTATLESSTELRDRTVHASASARGMLGKTSDVAAAAQQSATAMRDAAQTAAGLIRAIDEARREVDVATEVATRAASQSAEAVEVSEALTNHARAIESILGLIRDIAGQTNLLALNATIEAARAGDAGRGFAVVAQEVKNLASQTARATDDIAQKIASIQSATRQAVDANESIRQTVGEVGELAVRMRQAMDAQARTVTMITAAVDETALAADSMSSTIAEIRTDTENVAGDIDRLETGFRTVDDKLGQLENTAHDFAARIAV